jgi:hypothetical protein
MALPVLPIIVGAALGGGAVVVAGDMFKGPAWRALMWVAVIGGGVYVASKTGLLKGGR